MKRLRITKITVKTRETILTAKKTAEKNAIAHCPVCYAPINKMLPEATEISLKKIADKTKGEI